MVESTNFDAQPPPPATTTLKKEEKIRSYQLFSGLLFDLGLPAKGWKGAQQVRSYVGKQHVQKIEKPKNMSLKLSVAVIAAVWRKQTRKEDKHRGKPIKDTVKKKLGGGGLYKALPEKKHYIWDLAGKFLILWAEKGTRTQESKRMNEFKEPTR